MTFDPSQLGTTALLASFLLALLELIRRQTKVAAVLDERRVAAAEQQATATIELVGEIRRLVDQVDSLEDRFESERRRSRGQGTPAENQLPTRPDEPPTSRRSRRARTAG